MNQPIVNDLVVRFANVNGTGSASANNIFSKAIFRMGLPVSPKNIFPSNIQGLPTWYEVRISEAGYLGRREGIDILVGINPQSLPKDIASLREGGYLVYDSSKKLHPDLLRSDIHYLGIPMMELAMQHFERPRTQQLLKNIIYLGAMAAFLEMEIDVIKDLISEQFAKKPKLVLPNHQALELGYNYAKDHYACPLPIRVARRDLVKGHIMMEGNAATGLGAIYAGATVAAWYPITPSTRMGRGQA
ncbi:MAG: 2-oxoacid:acceptor oxidoreductase family protein [Bacteroidota bacterium]